MELILVIILLILLLGGGFGYYRGGYYGRGGAYSIDEILGLHPNRLLEEVDRTWVIDTKSKCHLSARLAAWLVLSATLALGTFAGCAVESEGGYSGHYNNWNGGYYRAPPVVYGSPYGSPYYGSPYYPPPVIYPGISIGLPGIGIGIQ